MKFKFHFVYFLAIVLMSSCVKEQGCTDPNADNYSSTAEENDGSCNYEGDVVFWYGESAAEFLIGDGATTLYFYVDNQVVGSEAANLYWTSAPDCGQNSSITVTKNLGTGTNRSYEYEVQDQTGWVYWSGVVNFTANTCLQIELN